MSKKKRMSQKQDRGDFSGISQKFSKSIYDTTKGRLRMAVLERDLAPLLVQTPTDLLDVGAGLGQVNQWFQANEFSVTHTDVSAEMVQAAQHNHEAVGLIGCCDYRTVSLSELANEGRQYSIVLCHAVLEWLPDTEQAIQELVALVAPGGTLSLMFFNRHAQLFANAVYGNFDYIERGLKVKKTVRLSPQNPVEPERVEACLNSLGAQVTLKTGVRCFHDYLRDIDHQQRLDELRPLEMKYNQQSPFRELGRYQHWLIQTPEVEE